MKRPKVVHVDDVSARIVRGPRSDGRWYWRAERRRKPVWRGWALPDEVGRLVIAAIAEGAEGPARRRADDGEIVTVQDLLECWQGSREDLAEVCQLAANSVISSEDGANRLIRVIGSVRVDRLDRPAIERYRDQSLRLKAAPSTVRLDIGYLRAAWAWARDLGHVPERILPRVPVKVPKTLKPRTDRDSVVKLIHKLEQDAPPWVHKVMRLLAATGARRSEIGALKRRHLFLDGEAPYLVIEDGKTGPRPIPLHAKLVEAIHGWDLPTDPEAGLWGVAPSTVACSLWTYYGEACRELGLPVRITPRVLRRLAVDTLYGRRTDAGTAASIMGHSEETALRYYRQATEDDLRAAVDGLDPLSPPPAPPKRKAKVLRMTSAQPMRTTRETKA